MKAEDIIRQMRVVSPFFTDRFSDIVEASSVTIAGSVVTVNSASPHGLSSGEYISVSGAQSPIAISSITQT